MEWRMKKFAAATIGLALAAGVGIAAKECCWRTEEPAQMAGDTANTTGEWEVLPLITVGEQNADGDDVNLEELGYRPLGILDGIGAWKRNKNTVRVLVNHELVGGAGYAYTLANGTSLKGARVSYFDIDRTSRTVCGAGLAYDRVFDRAGNVVTAASQLDQNTGGQAGGIDRLCSAHGFKDGEEGFEDDIYFCGEETANGQEFAIDVDNEDMYCVPMLGRAAWENLCAIENFNSDKVVLLIGDDSTAVAPIYLYIGEKGAAPASGYSPPSFLKRNGLGLGNLFVWVSDTGDDDANAFNGTGSSRKGKFKKITHFDPSKAGTAGWDSLGFALQATQYAAANALDSFTVARPEDCSRNRKDGTQAVLVSTGSSALGGADLWGDTYIIDFDDKDLEKKLDKDLADINDIKATVTIAYDGDDAGDGQFTHPDYGLRSPDNLDWANDGCIYIQEDPAVSGFGATSGAEASVWCLDPKTGKLSRILEMDRSSVPLGQTDVDTDIGEWESSGVIDVTRLFPRKTGETILLLDVQAASLRGGGLKQNAATEGADLVGGGQLMLAVKLNKKHKNWNHDCGDDD